MTTNDTDFSALRAALKETEPAVSPEVHLDRMRGAAEPLNRYFLWHLILCIATTGGILLMFTSFVTMNPVIFYLSVVFWIVALIQIIGESKITCDLWPYSDKFLGARMFGYGTSLVSILLTDSVICEGFKDITSGIDNSLADRWEETPMKNAIVSAAGFVFVLLGFVMMNSPAPLRIVLICLGCALFVLRDYRVLSQVRRTIDILKK